MVKGFVRFGVLVSLAGIVLSTRTGPTSAQSAVTGQLSVVWGDPSSGAGATQLIAYLATSAGERMRLQFAPGSEPSFAELHALSGQTVAVTGAVAGSLVTTERTFEALRLDPLPSADRLQADQAAVAGPQPWVTLRCRFGDLPSTDRAINTSMLTGSSYPSMDEYWREASFNTINVTGSIVTNWVTLPQPRSFYIGSSANLSALASDCTAASDAQVNFTSFVGINMLFNDALDCCLWGGSMYFTLDGASKVWRTTWIGLPSDNYNVLYAGLAHEMGHGFGMPHSSGPYSATYDSRWDIMSNAWVRYDSSLGQYNPQGTIAYHKDIGGWIPSSRRFIPSMNSTTTITLERLVAPIASSGYLMAKIPIGGSSTSFYTAEFRHMVGHDAWLPGTAVILHKVTTNQGGSHARVVDPDGNGNPNDASTMWTAGETFTDAASAVSIRVDSINATSATVTITLGTPAGWSLLVNFGAGAGVSGVWQHRYGSTWTQLHPIAPETISVGDLDGNGVDDLVIDFGSPHGLWAFRNKSTWVPLHAVSPTRVTVGDLDGNGQDEVIAHFANSAIWVLYNSTTWAPLHLVAPSLLVAANIDGTAGDDLVVDFPGHGVWAFMNNASWTRLHPLNATLIAAGRLDAATGPDDLIMGFAGFGIYQYSNHATWSFVHAVIPARVVIGDLDGGGRDDLIGDFGAPHGIWAFVNGSAWSQLHTAVSRSLAIGDLNGNGRADLAVDFGPALGGLWVRTDNGAWQPVHPVSPTDLGVARLP